MNEYESSYFSLLKMSTTTAKVVMFNMEIGETPSSEDEHVDHNKLEEMVKELSQSLTGMHFPKLLPDHFQFLIFIISHYTGCADLNFSKTIL